MAVEGERQPQRAIVDYERLFECVHCGLCLESCPTYILTRSEADSPRGRIYLMKALSEGSVEPAPEVLRHLDFCLGCRGCETACPSGVHYGRLIEQARAWRENNHRRPLGQRLKRGLAMALFPYPGRMRAALAPLKLLERIGLRPALTRVLPADLRDALELLPPLAGNDQAPPRRDHPGAKSGGEPSVMVHRGCVVRVLADSANRNSELLLRAAGYRVAESEDPPCCGALDLHSGNEKRALQLVRANVRAFKRSGAQAVISAASGCSAAMAEYGELLKDDPELADDAKRMSARVRDLSSLVLEGRVPSFVPIERTVTYHDACHLAHGMGVRATPRTLLRTVPGLRLVEMESADVCCGSAGTYNLMEPEAARELAGRKAATIEATGADCVVLCNPGCQFQIAAALRRAGSRATVVHLADFLAAALAQGG